MPSHQLTRIHVDYNSPLPGLVRVLRERHPDVQVGERVMTFDEDGNEVEGVVDFFYGYDHELMRIRLDMATWKDGPA